MGDGYAKRRLALARVVLDAGFAADAARAAYEALAAVIGALLTSAPSTHASLVARIYGELLPSGRLPVGAHGSLARLHDLTSLEAHGVEVDAELARAAVTEASEWLDRIGAPEPLRVAAPALDEAGLFHRPELVDAGLGVDGALGDAVVHAVR